MKSSTLTYEDFINIQKLNYGWRRWYGVVQQACLILVLVFFFAKPSPGIDSSGVFYWGAIIAVLLIARSIWYQVSYFRRTYDATKDFKLPSKVTFNEEKISWDDESSHIETKWTDLTQYMTSDAVIIVHKSPYQRYPILTKTFESKAEKDQFFSYLAKHNVIHTNGRQAKKVLLMNVVIYMLLAIGTFFAIYLSINKPPRIP